MMQDEAWTEFDHHAQWGGDYINPCFTDYMNPINSWWDPASVDQSFLPYGQGQEFEGGFEQWTAYEGIEDWSHRGPKFPPPNAPAPAVVEGMSMLEQAALESQALMFAPGSHLRHAASLHKEAKSSLPPRQKAVKPIGRQGIGTPPGLESSQPKTVDLPAPVLPVGALLDDHDHDRPRPLGLASMMEFGGSEMKEPLQRSITPATTAPPTPASSLSECEAASMPLTPGALPASGAAPGSDRVAAEPSSPPDSGSGGYSLFGGTAPWHSLQLGAPAQHQQKSEDLSLPAKVLSSSLAPIGTKVRLDDLLSKEDAPSREKESSSAGPPPGLFAPGPLLGPPGLALEDPVLGYKMSKRPPGLDLAPVAELPEELPTPASISSEFTVGAALEDKSLESVTVEQSEVNGVPCTRAVWRIVQLRGRLKTSLGKPVVSPPFTIADLGDLRLMVTPDAKGTLEGMRGKSKQSHFAKMLSQGPLECTLKVKVPSTTTPVVKFYLTVGPNCRQGPFTCDFMQHTVHGCNDFNCDWLKQVDDEGCLCVGLEIVEICTQRPA